MDVVLNSLSVEMLGKSLDVLREHDRVVELGKHDASADGSPSLRPLLCNRSLSLLDLNRMMLRRPASVGSLFAQVLGLVATGVFTPPPISAVPMGQVASAFQRMAQAQHTGKLVLVLGDPEAHIHVPAGARAALRSDGGYLVTGGVGGLSLRVADWLAEQGSGHLVLVSALGGGERGATGRGRRP